MKFLNHNDWDAGSMCKRDAAACLSIILGIIIYIVATL